MANVEEGVSLGGALVTTRSVGRPVPAGYRAFCTWEPMTGEAETRLFTEFWAWLSELRVAVASAGLLFRAYCYNAAAENTQMHRIAGGTGLRDAVTAFTGSEEGGDLLRGFGTQLLTGSPAGPTPVAPR